MNRTDETIKKVPVKTAKNVAYIGLFTALLVVCSFVTVPTAIPFTLQTLALFLALGVLGGKRGTLTIVCYIFLGIIGLPVFSGFRGGIGVIFGTTGGYIVGFIFTGLLYWGIEKLFGKSYLVTVISMLLGAAVYFAFGTAWFMVVYLKNTGPIGLGSVLTTCVVPFIIPDLIKISLASIVSYKLKDKIKD